MAAAQGRVSAFIEAVNRMDIDGAVNMLATDVVYHNIPMDPIHGREAARAFLSGMEGVTGMEWEIFNTAENGDTVLNEREDRFYAGEQKVLSIRVMGVFKVVGDKIVEWRDYFDMAELQAQQAQ